MDLDDFIKELKTKYPNANYESILKMVGTIYGKQETSKQILRASWVFDVCWHVHNKIGTMFKYAKEAKIPMTQTIRNYVKTKHYKENYKLFLGRDWLDLKAIKDGKNSVDQHVKNCNAIIISDLGKKLMAEGIDRCFSKNRVLKKFRTNSIQNMKVDLSVVL